MSDMSHRHTAKSSLRQLLAAHGSAGLLSLLGEVINEDLPARRGRPTREEAVGRAITKSLGSLIPEVITLEGKAMNAKAKEE